MPAHGRALQLVLVSDDTRLMWKNSCCLNVLGAHSLLSPALFMWLQMSLLLWFKPPSIKVMLRWSLGLSEVFKIPSFIFNILTHIICKSFHDCNIRGHSGLNSVCNISLLMCQAVLFSDESCSAMSSVCEGEVIICNIFSADWCDLAAGLFPAESTELLCPFEQNPIRLATLSLSTPWQICRTLPSTASHLIFHFVQHRKDGGVAEWWCLLFCPAALTLYSQKVLMSFLVQHHKLRTLLNFQLKVQIWSFWGWCRYWCQGASKLRYSIYQLKLYILWMWLSDTWDKDM